MRKRKELEEQLATARARALAAELELADLRATQSAWCMSIDDFVETFTAGLKNHLTRDHGNYLRKLHPEDLASDALTYAEVFFTVYENMNWREITGTGGSTDAA